MTRSERILEQEKILMETGELLGETVNLIKDFLKIIEFNFDVEMSLIIRNNDDENDYQDC